MPTPTYDLITSVTVGSTGAVTVANIPTTYRDLVVVHNNGYQGGIRVNNDNTSGRYSNVWMVGNGTTAVSGADSGTAFFNLEMSGAGSFIAQFLDYSATDKHKTVLFRVGDGTRVTAWAGRYGSTSAITEINFYSGLTAGTSLQIYGIAS